MQFDALWIMDMQDDVWPEAKTANPFIPIVCQREYNVPEADANSRLQMAKDMMIRLYQSAKDVVFSYSHWEGDRECRPTVLIQTFIEQNNIPTIEVTDSVKQQIFLSSKQELFYDSPQNLKQTRKKLLAVVVYFVINHSVLSVLLPDTGYLLNLCHRVTLV